MIPPTPCPGASTLRRLLLGETPEEESWPLEEHLLHCDHCLRAARTLPMDDPLVSALRQALASVTPAPRGELLEHLRLRLREMEPASRGADTGGAPSLAPPRQPDEIGRLGGYRILKELGRGGMGVVYQAEDPKLKRLVALKVMLPRLADDAGARRRFLREAQAMAAVHHDHVATVFQVDEDCGVPFLAMEFLQGSPLDQWLKTGAKPSVTQVLRMGREIAEGLAAAHERGLIHRDVKPGNVWLDSAHEGRVKILDFGLARAATEDVHLTRSGAIVGTPAYMSPEQARGEKVDERTDLFSLGCVLYKLCTGVLPFAGDTTTSLLMALALDHPRPVRDLNPDVPAELSDLVTKLLAKDPASRPQSAREVIQALLAVGRPVPAAGGKRRTWIVAAVAAGFLATAVGAMVVIIRDKDGNKVAVVNVPPGGTVKLVEDGKKGDSAVASKPPLDETWVNKVRRLPPRAQLEAVAAELKRRNPGFDGKVTPSVVDDKATPAVVDGAVTELQFVTDDVTDISPVRALPDLSCLKCCGSKKGAGRLSDLTPLKGVPLHNLDCGNNDVADLSPLRGMTLYALNCTGTRVSDLSPLKGMKLTYLFLGNTRVSDLSPLRGMPLTLLCCDGTDVSDLSPLKGMPLTVLVCVFTPVSDLSPLKGLPLADLCCDFKPERDAEILRSIKRLEKINGKSAAEFWKDVNAKKP